MVFLYHFAIPRKLNVEDVMGLNPSREFGELTSTGVAKWSLLETFIVRPVQRRRE